MVALAISTLALAAALALHGRSSADWRLLSAQVRLHEQLSWAVEALRADALLAGHWGQALEPGLVQVPAALRVHCRLSGMDATDWALRLEQPVAAGDNSWAAPCPLLSPRAGSDLLVLRHAGGDPVPTDAGQVQLAATPLRGQLFADGALPAAYPAGAAVHDVVINAWYVSDSSSFDPAQGSLRVLSLVKPGRLEDHEVATGIENLQVQFGLDTSGDGSVDRFVDPDDPAATTGTVRALRLWLLARSERAGAGFRDSNSWQPPDTRLGPIVPGVTPGYPAGHPRMAITQTMQLRNTAADD
jgi:type IV pilus assembly protein PilW